MRDIQSHMEQFLTSMVEEGREHGVQFAAYYRGELIVDAWAGIANVRTGQRVDGTTLFPIFSTGKGIVATIIHQLVERGALEYDMFIHEIWPEFGVNGKETTTIKHVLQHTSGIPYMPEGIDVADILDWDMMCDEISKLTPHSKPGDYMRYHAMTYGWVLGEIAQRVAGRSFAQIMREEICDPFDIQDMYIGIPDEVEWRVATLDEPAFDTTRVPTSGAQEIPAGIFPLDAWMNTSETRKACIPASNGIMSAQAIAKHYAALLPGGVNGVELIPSTRIKVATEAACTNEQGALRMSMGYQLGHQGAIMGANPAAFGHVGYGGSYGFADPEHKLAIGYTNNLYSSNSAGHAIMGELRKVLRLE